ncbi:MAG: hypothetical protein P8M68_05360 [Aquiluna sp.]|nr:hypothetical protein [Aquiluna sp.]
MAQLDPVIIRRRRVAAASILAILVVLVWAVTQLFAGPGQQAAEPDPTVTEEAIAAEITDCAPGVVSLQAMIGRLDAGADSPETLNSFASDTTPYLWYEVTNTGLVDCRFNVGTRVTFFTITSGEQTFYSSRDCNRAEATDMTVLLQSNTPLTSEPAAWDKVYSSSEGCSAAQGLPSVPTSGATYKLKAEVNGVISEDIRFILN